MLLRCNCNVLGNGDDGNNGGGRGEGRGYDITQLTTRGKELCLSSTHVISIDHVYIL